MSHAVPMYLIQARDDARLPPISIRVLLYCAERLDNEEWRAAPADYVAATIARRVIEGKQRKKISRRVVLREFRRLVSCGYLQRRKRNGRYEYRVYLSPRAA